MVREALGERHRRIFCKITIEGLQGGAGGISPAAEVGSVTWPTPSMADGPGRWEGCRGASERWGVLQINGEAVSCEGQVGSRGTAPALEFGAFGQDVGGVGVGEVLEGV